jgi:hypothetical protein
MGIATANHSIYFGHRNTDGSPDWGRSRECTGLQLLDVAGTRVKCVAPAWEGKQHDVIFHYSNGMITRFQFLTNGIKYEPPVITNINPALVPSGQAVTVTISGANFGNKDSNRTGFMDGGDGPLSIVPCNPLTYVSDAILRCVLTPKSSQKLKGNIFVTVGDDFVGGRQMTKATADTQMAPVPDPVPILLTIAKDIADIPKGSAAEATFVSSFKSDLVKAFAGQLSEDRINVTSITAGSVIVAFVILPDPNSATSLSPAVVSFCVCVCVFACLNIYIYIYIYIYI